MMNNHWTTEKEATAFVPIDIDERGQLTYDDVPRSLLPKLKEFWQWCFDQRRIDLMGLLTMNEFIDRLIAG